MSVDILQEKIRKTKNPLILYLQALPQYLPEAFMQEELSSAYQSYFEGLLEKLKDSVPAVRFGFGSFALMGEAGFRLLSRLMTLSQELGYYVLMDLPELMTPLAASNALQQLDDYSLDGVIVSCYLGSDVFLPLQKLCQKSKTVFAVCRTSNKSAVEVQDLLTGGRHVHTAVADIVSRCAEPVVARCGYSQMGILAAASTSQGLSTLRSKFSKLFLILDGADYPNANAKNCSNAFDRLGHGAVACVGESVVAAWKEGEGEPHEMALQAALRHKKNLTRYITIL